MTKVMEALIKGLRETSPEHHPETALFYMQQAAKALEHAVNYEEDMKGTLDKAIIRCL